MRDAHLFALGVFLGVVLGLAGLARGQSIGEQGISIGSRALSAGGGGGGGGGGGCLGVADFSDGCSIAVIR